MAQQVRATETRRRIIQAAAEVFEERGYAAAAMSEILSRSGLTKGALYFHFSSKEELAKAILEVEAGWAEEIVAGAASPLQAVIDITHGAARALQEDVRMRASYRLSIESGTFDRSGAYTSEYSVWADTLTSLLEQAKGAGDVRPETDPRAVAELLVGSFTGLQLYSQVRTGRSDLPEQITRYWQLTLPGLVQPRRLARFDPAGTLAERDAA